MAPDILRHDEITLEDSGPCDACGKSFAEGDEFVLDEYWHKGETIINMYHPACFDAAND